MDNGWLNLVMIVLCLSLGLHNVTQLTQYCTGDIVTFSVEKTLIDTKGTLENYKGVELSAYDLINSINIADINMSIPRHFKIVYEGKELIDVNVSTKTDWKVAKLNEVKKYWTKLKELKASGVDINKLVVKDIVYIAGTRDENSVTEGYWKYVLGGA